MRWNVWMRKSRTPLSVSVTALVSASVSLSGKCQTKNVIIPQWLGFLELRQVWWNGPVTILSFSGASGAHGAPLRGCSTCDSATRWGFFEAKGARCQSVTLEQDIPIRRSIKSGSSPLRKVRFSPPAWLRVGIGPSECVRSRGLGTRGKSGSSSPVTASMGQGGSMETQMSEKFGCPPLRITACGSWSHLRTGRARERLFRILILVLLLLKREIRRILQKQSLILLPAIIRCRSRVRNSSDSISNFGSREDWEIRRAGLVHGRAAERSESLLMPKGACFSLRGQNPLLS
ncbi:uncharacterized protein BJX67DRAFT_249871 [Aspergillus lucknowensis]|uniref:Secreted protein n=1 Tax=Aspergillus lucknowensis TaxID=176173 RepID=A0ABR4M1Z5_9EURO